MLRSSILRAGRSTSCLSSTTALRAPRIASAAAIAQTRHQHAISNPTLANIEKRWEEMEPQEQAELWMALRDRMKSDWNEMTLQEKKASYWIAFGPHGPRAKAPPGEGKIIALYTFYGIAAATVAFAAIRYMARGPAPTMTKEWQEATEEYMKKQRMEPITGYSGMMVQSPSKPGVKPEDDL